MSNERRLVIELICYKVAWNFLCMFMKHKGSNFNWNVDFEKNIRSFVNMEIRNNYNSKNIDEYLDYSHEIIKGIMKDFAISYG